MKTIRILLLCAAMLLAANSGAWGMSFEEFMNKSTQLLEEPDREAEAMALADRVLAQDAGNDPAYAGFAYFVKCWLYAHQGNFQAAHREADLAIRRASGKYAYMAKGLVYEQEGNIDAALRVCLEGAAKLGNAAMRDNCEKRYHRADDATLLDE